VRVAHGEHHTENGEKIIDQKPIPEAHAFMPMAAIADTATLPFWIIVTLGVNTGLMREPY
jgi:hypothetical protein